MYNYKPAHPSSASVSKLSSSFSSVALTIEGLSGSWSQAWGGGCWGRAERGTLHTQQKKQFSLINYIQKKYEGIERVQSQRCTGFFIIWRTCFCAISGYIPILQTNNANQTCIFCFASNHVSLAKSLRCQLTLFHLVVQSIWSFLALVQKTFEDMRGTSKTQTL